MDVRTFRAGSLHEALLRVRDELGPDAAVLQTREVRAGWWGLGRREVEVVASDRPAVVETAPPLLPDYRVDVQAGVELDSTPSLTAELSGDAALPFRRQDSERSERSFARTVSAPSGGGAAYDGDSYGGAGERSPDVARPTPLRPARTAVAPPAAPFELFTELLEQEFDEEVARELIERVRPGLEPGDRDDPVILRARLLRRIEQDLKTTGPIAAGPGRRRVVALVGPTGVGKTTTIAKLAANYRLRDRRRVGLVTVDTYRIAAVEQLRTYADIIDLPMEVVSTPREMRQAVQRMSDLELVLIDTAGRSPNDDVRIQELRALLEEARADEVHLVVACGATRRQLQHTTDRFAPAGVTALLLTKLDETPALGGLLPWLRSAGLPLSYLTHGQNVPQDIEPADRKKFARRLLGHA